MLDTIYTSTSGLQSFSKGLDVISGNVTNVNTFGYKSNTLVYEDVHYRFDMAGDQRGEMYGFQNGSGVAANITTARFADGDLRQTGNNTDVAIQGKGFFILDKDGEQVYTRDGQFTFDKDGDLASQSGGFKVQGMADNGSLQRLNQNSFRNQPAAPTTSISFIGNLSTGSTTATINNVTVFDSLGASHNFKITLAADTEPRTWKVSIADENGTAVGAGGSIAFQNNGSPADGTNTVKFTYQASGAAAQDIVLNFGDAGSFSGVTSFSGGTTSSVAMGAQNGHAQGSLLSITFDDKGKMIAKYSNQQTVTGPQLALANFDNLQALIRMDGAMFRAQDNQKPVIGVAGKDNFGTIAGGNLEASNVDLSQQFSDMIVIQRGYQASSQMLTVANEMMQQLLEMNKK